MKECFECLEIWVTEMLQFKELTQVIKQYVEDITIFVSLRY